MTQHRWTGVDVEQDFDEILWRCERCGCETWSWKRPRDKTSETGEETVHVFDGDSWQNVEITADCDQILTESVMEV